MMLYEAARAEEARTGVMRENEGLLGTTSGNIACRADRT